MIDKYLGIVLISVVLYYLFKTPTGTQQIIKSLSAFNVQGISALQGQNPTVL